MLPRARLALIAAAVLLPAAPAHAAKAAPGEVVVGYKDGRDTVIHARYPAAAMARLRTRSDVAYAVPNVVAHASQLPLPDDPGRSTTAGGWQDVQWNFLASGFGIDAPSAWQHAADAGHPGALGVTVAVLDTGVAYKNAGRYHLSPDLGGTRFARGYDFVRPRPSGLDRNGPGTHAASTVGATTIHGCLSDFSNDGRGLDLVAPGGGADADVPGDPNCHPTDPPGPDIFQMTYLGSSLTRFGLPSGYEGTSMAVPHVSATAALIIASRVLGAHPTPGRLEARLKQTASDLGPPGYDTRYGVGLINAGRP